MRTPNLAGGARRESRDPLSQQPMVSLDPTPTDLDYHYTEANRILVAFTKHGAYHERRGVAIVSSGLPVEAFDWGLLRPPFDDVLETAATVRACFAPSPCPRCACSSPPAGAIARSPRPR